VTKNLQGRFDRLKQSVRELQAATAQREQAQRQGQAPPRPPTPEELARYRAFAPSFEVLLDVSEALEKAGLGDPCESEEERRQDVMRLYEAQQRALDAMEAGATWEEAWAAFEKETAMDDEEHAVHTDGGIPSPPAPFPAGGEGRQQREGLPCT
jgi:hypothetical protein